MSASSSGSYNPRIYGKRSGIKRKQADQPSEPVSQGDTTLLHSVVVRKRRKLSVEPFVRTPSPPKAKEDVGTDLELSPLIKPKVTVTYGSPRKRNSSPLAPLPPSPGKPTKPARDLSTIFDSIVPSSAPPPSPSKLAKRMLARSKTESSIGSQTSTNDNSLGRTPSLPNLPSSPSRRSDTHTASSQPSTAIIPALVPNFKPPATKTYAGNFRSFLVPLPAASSSNLDFQGVENRDDEFESRESYSSLRSRWGVDNSEDDPYVSPSPSKSNSATPNVSPSKGRPKAPLASPIGVMNPLKSISELRNKGESRRFLDEIGYLFEGMDKSGGIGLRRASALQITTKLCDADFVRKAKAVDFFSRTWDAFLDAGAGKGEDNILDIILVFFAALAARDTSILSDLAQRSSSKEDDQEGHGSFVDTLFQLLGIVVSKNDPLLLVSSKTDIGALIKKAGINKRDFETVKTIHQTILSKSHLFSPDVQISTSLLIMHSLHSLSPSDIPTSHLPTLLASLRLCLEVAGPAASLISALYLQWRDAADAINYENVCYHLQLLDTYLSNQWGSPQSKGSQDQEADQEDWREINENVMGKARDEWLVDDLIALGVCTELELQTQEDSKRTIQKCLEWTLRILVTLTHADELWGCKVVQCEYTMNFLLRIIHNASQSMVQGRGDMVKVEGGREENLDDRNDRSLERAETRALDTLCLSLGLLTNLVQVVKEAKGAVRETRLSPSCALKKRACARRCTCSPSSSGLDILANIYIVQGFKTESSESSLPADAAEALIEADASFLRGHLAVLFGLLMSDSPENQSAILESLPLPTSATSSRVQKNKTDNKVKLSRLAEQARDFVAFYAAVSRHSEEGEKESKVAKSVVRFLEKQRDAAS
ncbi:hypothetical protein BYT27DRAFT_7094210 [Phlegmacium glaucopus]|nr:hypothetical protein BYT27DRAFT_7094210 [Phlegmacium glaucopus]